MASSRAPARATAAVRSLLGARGSKRPTRHRSVQGNTPRAAVLGAGDGLLTNVSLVLGVAGASTNASTVRLAGVAGLLAGAFSMAAGELVSVRAQQELMERELQVERDELAEEPEAERHELAAMYRARGVPAADADTVARILSANAHVALDTHARLELGIDPEAAGSAGKASVVSFFAFGWEPFCRCCPWFFTGGTGAVIASIVIGALAALLLGGVIGSFTGRGVTRTALRQLAAAIIAAGVTFGVGSLLGVSAT